MLGQCVLIETYWNVNSNGAVLITLYIQGINRNILECKLQTIKFKYVGSM